MLPIPILLRIARRLHAAWSKRDKPEALHAHLFTVYDRTVAEVVQIRHRATLATAHRLIAAERIQKEEIDYALARLGRSVQAIRDELVAEHGSEPGLCDWVREVRHLETEFPSVEVLWAKSVLRAVTEPITLAGIALGAFAIDLHWDRARTLNGVACFDIVALHPHSARSDPDVVHPHVQDGSLCAGDADRALMKAVADGRLAEAFLLIRGVLGTYNPSSAYVAMRDWDGFNCSDCRRRIHREEQYTCESCGSMLCDECERGCPGCSTTRCSDCSDPCDRCELRFCRACLTVDDDRFLCDGCAAAEREEAETDPELQEDTDTDDDDESRPL